MTHLENAGNVRATLARFINSNDARKLDPLPLLLLAQHGAEARGDFELARDIGVSIEVIAEKQTAAKIRAREQLVAAEAAHSLDEEFPVSDTQQLINEGVALEAMASAARAELEKAPDHEPLDPEERVV